MALGLYGPREGSADVALSGTLVVESNCVMLRSDDDEPVMLGWPVGYELEEADGEQTVVNGDGRRVATVGSDTRLGGGPIPVDQLHTPDGEMLPGDCQTDHAFAVAEVSS